MQGCFLKSFRLLLGALPAALLLALTMVPSPGAAPGTDQPLVTKSETGSLERSTRPDAASRPALLEPHAPAAIEPPPLVDSLIAAQTFVDAGLMPAPRQPAIDWAALARVQAAYAPPVQPAREAPSPVARDAASPRAPAATPTRVVPNLASLPTPTVPVTTSGAWIDTAYTRAVWDAVNELRTDAGLAPVAVETRLERAAVNYATVMSETDWFSHTGPDGSTFVQRLAAAGFPFESAIGEVLAWATEGFSPAQVAKAWLDSPPHREQILGAYTRAGLGCAFARISGAVELRCAMEFAA